MTGADDRSILEWGSAEYALERDCGDARVVAPFEAGALVGVIDGLGHGWEAAQAAREAVRILEEHAAEPVTELVQRCHQALRSTRGAVMTLASFDARGSSMTWAGVGNVEAFLLRGDPTAEPAREAVNLRGGVVGYQLPQVRASSLRVAPGDMLVMATDGVRSSFAADLRPYERPQDMADGLLARHARRADDALVLVARYLGVTP